jgi:hypothetical protein
VTEFTKRKRQQLRELAGVAYEAELALLLNDLSDAFDQWHAGELLPSELMQTIHEFHQGESRRLWSMYQTLRETDIVARGLAQGLLAESRVPSSGLKKLDPIVHLYRK